MKKILAFILCAIMICAFPVVAFAEETVPAEETTIEVDTLPTTEETPTESEISGTEEVPTETEEVPTETVKAPSDEIETIYIEVEMVVGETFTHEYKVGRLYDFTYFPQGFIRGNYGGGIIEATAIAVGECSFIVKETNAIGDINKITNYKITIKETAEEEPTDTEVLAPIEPEETEPSETTPPDITVDDPNDLTVEKIVAYVKGHIEDILSILTVICSAIFTIMKLGVFNKSATTLNNNSVAIAEESAKAISDSLGGMQVLSTVVDSYKGQVAELLNEVRRNDAERTKLEENLTEVSSYLKATRLANKELANEVAELLVLANIPNSKKDELYARHIEAVKAIDEAEKEAVAEKVEVEENEEGKEA